MPNRKPKVSKTVIYRSANKGKTAAVVVTATQPLTPANSLFTLTPSASGGTLATATYSYRIGVVVRGLESESSVAKTAAVTGPTGQVTVDATALLAAYPQATSWKLYGRVGGSEALIATVTAPTATFVDTGSVSPSGAVIPNDGRITFRDRGAKTTRTAVALATSVAQTDRYFNQ